MKLTIQQAYQLHQALNAVSSGFPTGAEGSPRLALKTGGAAIAVARNLNVLRPEVVGGEKAIAAKREALAAAETAAVPDSKELTGPRLEEFTRFVREVNEAEVELPLEPIPTKGVDFGAFCCPSGAQVLAVLLEHVLDHAVEMEPATA